LTHATLHIVDEGGDPHQYELGPSHVSPVDQQAEIMRKYFVHLFEKVYNEEESNAWFILSRQEPSPQGC
jgi:hypothetical protein